MEYKFGIKTPVRIFEATRELKLANGARGVVSAPSPKSWANICLRVEQRVYGFDAYLPKLPELPSPYSWTVRTKFNLCNCHYSRSGHRPNIRGRELSLFKGWTSHSNCFERIRSSVSR